MKEVLKTLVKLQEIDSELMDLEQERGDLPESVEKLQTEVQKLSVDLEEAGAELTALQRQHREKEGELSLMRDKFQKYQNQLYSVTTTREYDALSTEIDTLKAKIDGEDGEISGLIDREEDLAEKIQALEKEHQALQEDLQGKEGELSERLSETEDDLVALQHEREKLVVRLSKIDRQLLADYDRIRAAKNGVAVAEIYKKACGGCFKTLPLQKIVEIKKMERIILCEVCGRILVPEKGEYLS